MSYLRHIQIRSTRRNGVHRALAAYLTRDLELNSSVLDVGAGRMEFINNVPKGFVRYAIDSDNECKRFCDSDVNLLIGDWNLLSNFENDFFDLVYCSNFLEHLDLNDARSFLSEMRRTTSRDGKLVLIQPNWKYSFKHYFDDITHRSIFSHESLVTLLQVSGFRIICCYKKFLPYSFKSRLRLFSFLIPLYLKLPFKFLPGQMLVIASPK